MRQNVLAVVEENLCISCGICAAVCPVGCITYQPASNGMYHPVVSESCVSCGKCLPLCPGIGMNEPLLCSITKDEAEDKYAGRSLQVYTAQSKDEKLLECATSGGVVSTLIRHLLQNGSYDSAFVVQSENYRQAVLTERITKDADISKICKSRYLPVMHTDAVRYLLAHRDERIIFVGVPCFFERLVQLIAEYRLNRENYLLLGLCCDRTMTYRTVDYFDRLATDNKPLRTIHFRTKEGKGWPGGLGVVQSDESKRLLPSFERIAVKDYFMPERCLYCLDKLNRFADISVGDNYTGKNTDAKGTSSVILRTERGQACFAPELFELFESDLQAVSSAQHIDQKQYNRVYQMLKSSKVLQINTEYYCTVDVERASKQYTEAMAKLSLGQGGHMDQIAQRVADKRSARAKQNRRLSLRRLLKKLYRKLKRKNK